MRHTPVASVLVCVGAGAALGAVLDLVEWEKVAQQGPHTVSGRVARARKSHERGSTSPVIHTNSSQRHWKREGGQHTARGRGGGGMAPHTRTHTHNHEE